MIKINNLNKYYHKGRSNQIHVINDVNLDLPETSLVTILGDSGSGKSTLLNVIGGLDSAKGNINYFDELEVANYSASKVDVFRNNNIGYIFQNYNLIDELTVYENLVFALELIGITDKAEVDEKIDAALDLVSMRRYKRRNALALSGGQQQRVSIARAIVKGAKVLIADEPTGNLDSRNTIDVMNILKSLSSSCLVLLVTHDKDIAYKYADRIIELKDGKIVTDKDYQNTALQGHDDVLYLSDYNHKNFGDDCNYLNIYSNENTDIGVNLYIKDNVVYVDVKSNLQTKVIGLNSNIEVVDVKPEEVEIPKLDIDLFINKSISDHSVNYFKYFLSKLWYSFRTFLNPRIRVRLMYIAFIFIGIMLCSNISSFYAKTTVSVDDYVSNNLETVYVKAGPSNLDFIWDEEISDIHVQYDMSKTTSIFSLPIIYNYNIDVYLYALISSQSHYSDLKYTDTLAANEILISNYVAEEIIDSVNNYKNFTISDLINYEILIDGNYYTIVGVEDLANMAVIFNHQTELSLDWSYQNYESMFSKEYSKYSYYLASDAPSLGLEIDETGVTLDGNKINIYVSSEFSSTEISNLDAYYGVEFNVIEVDDLVGQNIIFFDSEEDYAKFLVSSNVSLPDLFYREDYVLTSGVVPTGDNEVLIADIFAGTSYEAYVENNYVVTGYYAYESDSIPAVLTSYKEYLSFYSQDYYKYHSTFLTNDLDALVDYFIDNGYDAYYYKDYIMDNVQSDQIADNMGSIVSTTIMLGISLLFIFFIGRSKMLTRIKNIGIYRALGSSKLLILITFIAEGIVIATFTIGLGYIGSYIVLNICAQSITYAEPYVFGFGYFLVGVLGIYVCTILAMSLPVLVLLRKTPIEIIAKYDI